MLGLHGLQASWRLQGGSRARALSTTACWHAHGLRPLRAWQCTRPRVACMASQGAASHYEVLGLDAESSDDEIKTAFRRAAKRLHPDVNKEPGAEKRFIRINEAYATLSDPQRRRQYDAQLRAAAASRSAAGRASTRSSSSSSSVWVEYTWVVDSDDDSDDEDDEDVMEFFRWSTSGQNMRSSYQSSWQANAKKRQARQGAAQAQQGDRQRTAGQRRQEVSEADRAEILRSLRTDVRQYAQKIFGRRLEHLETWKQMDEFFEAMEAMHLQDMGLHSYDSDDDPFDSDDDDDDGWVRSTRGSRAARAASSSAQQAAPGARKSKTWGGDVDWETFVADFDTGSASSSKARQRQASSPFASSGRGAAAGGAAAGSRGSGPGRGARQPATPKMNTPPRRKPAVDDDDDDDDELDLDELEQLLSILVETEDVGAGRKRASSRRPRGRRQ